MLKFFTFIGNMICGLLVFALVGAFWAFVSFLPQIVITLLPNIWAWPLWLLAFLVVVWLSNYFTGRKA